MRKAVMGKIAFKKWMSSFTALVFLFQQISPAFAMDPPDNDRQKGNNKGSYQAKKDLYNQQKLDPHLTSAEEEAEQGNDAFAAYHQSEAEKILNEQEDRLLALSLESPLNEPAVPFKFNLNNPDVEITNTDQDFFPSVNPEEQQQVEIKDLLHCLSTIITSDLENYQSLREAVTTDAYTEIENNISNIKEKISSNLITITQDNQSYKVPRDKELNATLKKELKKEKEKLNAITKIKKEEEQEFSNKKKESLNYNHMPSFLTTEEELQNGAIFDEAIASIYTPKPLNVNSSTIADLNTDDVNIEDDDDEVEDEATKNKKEKEIKNYLDAIKKNKLRTLEQEKVFSTLSQNLVKEMKSINETFSEWTGPLIILLGETGSGKTTLVNWLTGQPMNALQDPNNSRKLILSSTGDGIVHGVRSGTTLPGLWKDPQKKVAYADCPGLGDTRGTLKKIKNAYYLRELFKGRKDVRFLLTEDADSFEGHARGTHFVDVLYSLKAIFKGGYPLKNGLSLVVTKHNPLTHKDLNELQKQISQLSDEEDDDVVKELLDYFSKGENRIALFSRPPNIGPFQNDEEKGRILYNIDAAIPLSFSFIKDISLSLPPEAALWCNIIHDSLKMNMIKLLQNKVKKETSIYIKNQITENKKSVDGLMEDAMKLYTPFVLVFSPPQEDSQDIQQTIRARTLANSHWSSLWSVAANIGEKTANILKKVHDNSPWLICGATGETSLGKKFLLTKFMLAITNGDWEYLKSSGLLVGFINALTTLIDLAKIGGDARSKNIPLTDLTQTTIEAIFKGMPLSLVCSAIASSLIDNLNFSSKFKKYSNLITEFQEFLTKKELLFRLTQAATATVTTGMPLIAGGITTSVASVLMKWSASFIKKSYFIKKEAWKTELASRIKELKRQELSVEFNRLAKELRMAKFDIHGNSLLRNNGLLKRIKPDTEVSEIEATAKSLECIYQISGKHSSHFSREIWQPTFSPLEKTLRQYAKQSAEALYAGTASVTMVPDPEESTFDWLNNYGEERESQPLRIGLSIDGGGTRGLIPALYLEEIEALSRKPIYELFDVVGGTSVGGILGLGFVVPGENGSPLYQAGEFVELFRQKGKTIFSVHSSTVQEFTYKNAAYSWQARYKPDPLEEILAQKFKTVPLSAALKPIVIPAVQTQPQAGESCVYLFDSRLAACNSQKNFYMKDVARATAAAPTYFPAALISSVPVEGILGIKLSLLDGGILTNNPSEHVYNKMRGLWPDSQRSIVSFGTGVGPRSSLPENAGNLKFAKPGIETLMSENELGIETRMSSALGRHYLRLQTDLGREIGLDDATDSTLDFLQGKAEERLNDLEDITRFLLINNDAWKDAGGSRHSLF